MTARISSLISGMGGLDLAAEAVFGGHLVWRAETALALTQLLGLSPADALAPEEGRAA